MSLRLENYHRRNNQAFTTSLRFGIQVTQTVAIAQRLPLAVPGIRDGSADPIRPRVMAVLAIW